MNAEPCSRAPEVRLLAARGQWPLACPADLALHLRSCPACADLLLLEIAFREEKSRAADQARLPAPGTLWWRARLRRRRAAVERMEKPLVRAQVFALALCLPACIAVFLWLAHSGLPWLSRLKFSLADSGLPFSFANSSGSVSGFFLLISLLAGLALLGSVLVCYASGRQTRRQ